MLMIDYVVQYALIIYGDIMVYVEHLVQMVLHQMYQIYVLGYVMLILLIRMGYVLQIVLLIMLILIQDYVRLLVL